MTIPFLNLSQDYEALRQELDDAYQRVLRSGWYILGREVEAFEREFAAYIGVRHCIAVGNGLDAIHLALRACGIGAGDEVLVPAHTFIATWLAVSHAGAVPVPVEPDENTCNLDVSRLATALTRRTRALIPVHLYGQPADMTAVLDFARRHDLRVIEDAAQAHGARCRGRRVGGLGDAGAFSFYPVKNLGCFGDGGAITTNDDALAEQARLLRNYGSRVKYAHESTGFNSRLDELQAAFLRVKLRYLDSWNAKRAELAARYDRGLRGSAGLNLPGVREGMEPVWHLYVVRHSERDRLQQHLQRAGIGTMVHYPTPPHLTAAYANLTSGRPSLPVAERLARHVLSLPMGPHLSAHDVDNVIEAVRTFNETQRRDAA